MARFGLDVDIVRVAAALAGAIVILLDLLLEDIQIGNALAGAFTLNTGSRVFARLRTACAAAVLPACSRWPRNAIAEITARTPRCSSSQFEVLSGMCQRTSTWSSPSQHHRIQRRRPSGMRSSRCFIRYTGGMVHVFRPLPVERLKLLVFDLDGTLIDSAQDLCNSVNAALAQFGLVTRSPTLPSRASSATARPC